MQGSTEPAFNQKLFKNILTKITVNLLGICKNL